MNKVKLLILTLFIVLTTNVNAQLGIGLKGGADFNSITRSNAGRIDETYHGKKDLGYGLILRYQVNDWFAMRADVEMLSRSHSMKRNLNFVNEVYTDYKNNYLTLPVMADFTFGGSKLRGHFLMGGFVGYWLSSNRNGKTIDMSMDFPEFDEKLEFNQEHNRLAAGLVGGTGVSYDISNNIALELDAVFYYDLTSYMKINELSVDPRYNNTLSLTLGVIYKL